MASYNFKSHWVFESPIEPIWQEIINPAGWPTWWKGLDRVITINPGGKDGLHSVRIFCWGYRFIYTLTFSLQVTDINHFKSICGEAQGDVDGSSKWTFSQEGKLTYVEYDWNIVTNKVWMNIFAPMLRPVFVFNHNLIMGWGAKGLAKKLGIKLHKATS